MGNNMNRKEKQMGTTSNRKNQRELLSSASTMSLNIVPGQGSESTTRNRSMLIKSKTVDQSGTSSGCGIVVVNKGRQQLSQHAAAAEHYDPDLVLLMNTPKFRPILFDRNQTNAHLSNFRKDSLSQIYHNLSSWWRNNAKSLSDEQDRLVARARRVDLNIDRLQTKLTAKQQEMHQFERKLDQVVSECSLSLTECHNALSACFLVIHSINDMLDVDQRFRFEI